MMRLSAAHLKEIRRKDPTKRLVWLDIGGGTGANVEMMDKYFPISQFDGQTSPLSPHLLQADEKLRSRLRSRPVCAPAQRRQGSLQTARLQECALLASGCDNIRVARVGD